MSPYDHFWTTVLLAGFAGVILTHDWIISIGMAYVQGVWNGAVFFLIPEAK